jgi:two-component system response regulator FixJ
MNKIPMKTQSIVYVVDDDKAVCDSIQLFLESVNLPVQTYTSAREFLARYKPSKSSCLLLDIRMPDIDGFELQEYLSQQKSTLPIIIITGHADVPMAVRTMKAGAFDFIEKPFDLPLLLERVQEALRFSQNRFQIQPFQVPKAATDGLTTLTRREREVMKKLVDGKYNKDIAKELNISHRTVEGHRASIMEKLQAKSLSDVIKVGLLA